MNVAVIHAHPDDELLFAGALILANPYWRWALISLTGGLRKREYDRLSPALAKRGIHSATLNLGLDDTPDFDPAEWDAAIAALPQPDLVVTHGADGEYGHPHHIAVHESVHRHFPKVWDFAHDGMTVQASAEKATLFREVYGSVVLEELRADKTALINGLFEQEYFVQ